MQSEEKSIYVRLNISYYNYMQSNMYRNHKIISLLRILTLFYIRNKRYPRLYSMTMILSTNEEGKES